MPRLILSVAVAAASLACVASAVSAQVTYSFETATGPEGDIVSDGFRDANGNPAFLSLDTATGVTRGTSSLQADIANANDFTSFIRRFDTLDGSFSTADQNLFVLGGTLTVDVFVDFGDNIPDGARQVFLARQGRGTSFDLGTNPSDQPDNFANFRTVVEGQNSLTFTLPNATLDPAFQPAGTPGSNPYEIAFGGQRLGAGATLYFDNVVFTPAAPIPEPAAAGVLGLGAMGLLARRRGA